MATLDAICDVLGVSAVTVGNLVKSGVVVKRAPGDYDGAQSCKNYIAHLRRRADAPSLVAARTRLAEERAAMAAIDRQMRTGEVIDVAHVEQVWTAIMSAVRTRALALPSKCAARVGMAKTTSEVAAILRAEVYDMLTELSQADVVTADEPAGSAPSLA